MFIPKFHSKEIKDFAAEYILKENCRGGELKREKVKSIGTMEVAYKEYICIYLSEKSSHLDKDLSGSEWVKTPPRGQSETPPHS